MLLKKEISIERTARFVFQFDDGTTTEKKIKQRDMVTIVWNNSGHKEKITGRILNIEIDHFEGLQVRCPHNTISVTIDGSTEFSSHRRRIDADMILNILYPNEVDPDEEFEDAILTRDNYTWFGISDLNSAVVIIPETYRYQDMNYRIVGIDDNTFYNCDRLAILGLPKTLISIGSHAFFGCKKLTEVHLPDSLRTIGNCAFMNCEELQNVNVPASIPVIGVNAFYNVGNVNYSGNISEAPWGAKRLNSMDIGNEIIDFHLQTFSLSYVPDKEGDVTIPMIFNRSGKTYKIIELGNDLFAGCTELTSIVIPTTVTAIGENCFLGCTGLESIDVPSSVVNIGDYAFQDVANVNYTGTAKGAPWGAKMINGEEYIKEEHIENFILDRKNLTKAKLKRTGDVVIPETFEQDGITYLITEIANDTFFNSNELKSVVIPDSVKRIGNNAFANCSKLTTVSFNNIHSRSLDPDTSLLEEIGDNAFSNCISLGSIRLPNNASHMGKECFSNCINLKTINIPDNMDYIPEACFTSCFSLSKAIMGTNMKEIRERAFHNCMYLVAYIADTVVSIEEKAFFNVQMISYKGTAEGGPWGAKRWLEDEGISIEDSTKPEEPTPDDPEEPYPPVLDLVLSRNNLDDVCINVNGNITIPETYDNGACIYKIVKIADNTFKALDTIKSVGIPDSVTEIGEFAFYHCVNLERVIISDNVKTIGQYAFAYCTSLYQVNIPNGLKVIEDNTFMFCSALPKISIPAGVTTICTEAFYQCGSLGSLTVPNAVSSIGESAFYDVPSVYYYGDAAGYPWGADIVNDVVINVTIENPPDGEDNKEDPDIGQGTIVPDEDEWD